METTAPLSALFELWRNLVQRDEVSVEEREAARALRKKPQFSLLGVLSAGKSTEYSINGVDFEVDPTTTILGELRFGARAKVSGTYRHHTIRCAHRVLVEPRREIQGKSPATRHRTTG